MTSSNSSPLALHGGQPIRDTTLRPWPGWPIHGEEERRAMLDVLESGGWWYGERVAQFERDYAAFQGAAHCVSCSSGTTAIEIVLQALGIGPGDEVIVPPYTFIATASAVVRVGATPVFVDVDDTWCMAPEGIAPAITGKTRVIMPVHFGGRIADMDRINAIAAEYGLIVVEDACHAWGARWNERGAGVLGRCGVFSFQHSKNITAGEGGAIVTDDADLALLCKSLTNCGRDPIQGGYRHLYIGTNARISEFAAGILLAQLGRLEEQTQTRADNGAYLAEKLGAIPGIIPQPGDDRITRRGYHLYCMRIDPGAFGCSREKFIEAVKAEGLELVPGYPLPLYKQPVFAAQPRYAAMHLPMVEDLCDRSAMWFRHSTLLGSREDMDDIAAMVHKVKANVETLGG
ncbi:MAG: DegT/DnrJ/EryC1/StrS family aminotransferase [Candidatus Hydrogenedentota bacterium]